MRVLLLGSSGALGTAMESVLQNRKIPYIAVNHRQVEATVFSDLARVVNHTNPTVIFNAIGIPRIKACEDDPIQAFNVNTVILSYLTRICRDRDIILAHASSHAVFDGKKTDGYYTEKDQPNPLQDYGISKLAAECFVRTWEKHYIFRLPTMYGDRRNFRTGLIDDILRWMDEQPILRIADDRIDSYSWTMDVANRIVSILKQEIPFGLYHVANEGMLSLYFFVLTIKQILGRNIEILRAKDKDFPCTTLKSLRTPIKSIFFKPLRPWHEALYEYFQTRSK